MMMKKCLVVGVLIILSCVTAFAGIKDSTGVKKASNGNMIILHKVEAGETLWGLYSKYKKHGATVDGIKKANNGSSSLSKGQVVNIPTTKKYKSRTNSATPTTGGKNKIHTVQAGETLYAISRKHGVSVANIQKWNNLSSNSLSKGQKLIVGKGTSSASMTNNTTSRPVNNTGTGKTITHKVQKGETLYAISRKHGVSVGQLKALNPNVEKGISVGAILIVKKGTSTVDSDGGVHENITATNENHKKIYTGYEKVVQEGTASRTNRKDFDEKFSYIFHKTIPYGVIVTITNPKTGEYTYARVIGKLSSSSSSLIEISPTVWSTLKLSGKSPKIKIAYVL